MKKRICKYSVFIFALMLGMLIFTQAYPTKIRAANSVLADYIPNGAEKIKPEKPVLDGSNMKMINASVRQNGEILKLLKDYEQSLERRNESGAEFSDFELKYNVMGLDAAFQFDISVDGSEWQYNDKWNDLLSFEYFKDGFNYFAGAYNEETTTFSLIEAESAGSGILKDAVKNGEIDPEGHEIKVRYRYVIMYMDMDDIDGWKTYFTDWSDEALLVKTASQAQDTPAKTPVETPDEIPEDTTGEDEQKVELGQVKNLKVKSLKTTSLKLSWSKVDGAESYEISDSDGNLIASSKKNSITLKNLKPGTGYEFRVRAKAGEEYGVFSETVKTPTKPGKVSISSVTSKSANKIITKYKKVAGTGYELQFASDKEFKNVIKTADVKNKTKITAKIAKTSGLTCYVRVRAYFTYGGKTVYGAWSKVKSVKVK